jgi:hypothetical protein
MTKLEINQVGTPQNLASEPKKREWKRTTFNFFDGKAWCYQKLVQLPH